MAAPVNKKNAAAKGAKAIREDQVAAKAIPGRVTSIDFEQFNTPTAQAIVNEVTPPATAPIAPPGVEQAAAAGALTANAILRDKVAAAEGRPIDTGDNPNWGEPPAAPILEKAIQASAAVAKTRNPQSSFVGGKGGRNSGPGTVTIGPGRSYSFNEMLSLNPPGESLFRLADGSLDVAGASREIARSNLKNPVSLADVEAGRAIVEQVQQGTPVIEVVSGYRDTGDNPDWADDRLSTSAVPVSRYATPGTPEADRAAAMSAASGGMGAAGGGEGGGGGGRVPPPRNPNDFNPNRPNRPSPPVPPVARLAGEVQLEPGLWNHLKAGWRAQAGDANYSDSVIGDTFRGRQFPEQTNSSIADKALYLGGRVGADIVGYGTRKGFWNMNPEDALGTLAREGANWAGLNGREAQLARYATASTVGLASANYNPFNFGEGGRPTGFGAVNPTDEDPRKTDNPIGELLFDRAMLGRTGRLLPWQEFHEERPDVSYEKYAKYQDYIRGPSFMGLAKGTMDGIDGPEARVVGYRVQPEAILAAAAAGAATIAAFKYGGKRL